MKLDNDLKKRLREFSRAAKRAVEESPEAQLRLDWLRSAGFEAELRVRLVEIADQRPEELRTGDGSAFTESDVKELGRMSIRID